MTEQFGRASLPVIPLRAEPSHRAEMVSQVLLGEPYKVIQKMNGWCQVRCLWDEYVGWICENQHSDCTAMDVTNALQPSGFAWDFKGNGRGVLGTPIYNYAGLSNVLSIDDSFPSKSMADLCLTLLNVPYLWGGRSEYGIDCSGLVQLVARAFGRKLPRDAWQQSECVEKLPFGEHGKDNLAFFVNDNNKITHVGVILDANTIVHASGCVRVDMITEEGIFIKETGVQTHRLAFIGLLN